MRTCLALGTLLLIPAAAAAQAPRPRVRGVPLVALDLLVGISRSSTPFLGARQISDFPVGRVALAVRVAPKGRLRPVVILDHFSTWGYGDDLVCYLDSNGSCSAPEDGAYSGWGLGVGLRAVPRHGRMNLGVAFGTDWYRRHAWHVEADVAVSLGRHLAFTSGARYTEVHRAGPGKTWLRPITFGLRIQ